jgi:hypothetical protein
MAFPFFPGGAITATLVLGGTLVVFRMLLLALDRGAAELRGSIGPGLVRGVRAWVAEPEHAEGATPATPWPPGHDRPVGSGPQGWSMPAGVIVEELTVPSDVDLEAVRPRR